MSNRKWITNELLNLNIKSNIKSKILLICRWTDLKTLILDVKTHTKYWLVNQKQIDSYKKDMH